MAPALLPAVPASGWPNAKPENVSLGDASMDQDLRIPEDTHKTTWRWASEDEDRPSDDVHTACGPCVGFSVSFQRCIDILSSSILGMQAVFGYRASTIRTSEW